MRWVIRSRSSSSAASISGVASSGQYKIPGTFRHGKIRLIIRVGKAGLEQPSYLQDPVHEAFVIVPVAIGGPIRCDQILLLVIAQQPARGPGPLGQLADPHVTHLTTRYLDLHINVTLLA